MKVLPLNKKRITSSPEEHLWLGEVREVNYPLDDSHPIFIRELKSASEDSSFLPASPQKHGQFEINFLIEGSLTQSICGEKIERRTGDILLLSPGLPHQAEFHSKQYQVIVVYFLPMVLLTMGPIGDGAWVLSHFTSPRAIGQRIIRPPSRISAQLHQRLRTMVREFKAKELGSELRMWSLFSESLIDLFRSQLGGNNLSQSKMHFSDWTQLGKALRHIQDHCYEPLYIEQIATLVGLTPNRLRKLFKHSLGMSCTRYIRTLRISQAKARLSLPDAQVTEVALSVGFETFSHFNTSFREITGMSPSQYVRSVSRSMSFRRVGK